MRRRFSLSPLLSLACLVLLLVLSSNAMARSESEIKAFYLYNFIKFINWPTEDDKPDITICIHGDNPFGAFTEKLNTLKARNRSIRVVDESQAPFSECAILFVSASESNLYTGVIEQLDVAPVLTVSDIEDFTGNGGMIGFIKAGNVVRFDINLKQARDAGLEISAKLLKLANKVEQ